MVMTLLKVRGALGWHVRFSQAFPIRAALPLLLSVVPARPLRLREAAAPSTAPYQGHRSHRQNVDGVPGGGGVSRLLWESVDHSRGEGGRMQISHSD